MAKTVGRFRPGKRAPTTKKSDEPKLDLLAKLRKAEAQLKDVRDSDPNAKFALARMRSQQLFVDTNDTDYWIAFAFSSRAQKEAFLKAAKFSNDEDEDRYFSGPELATKMRIPLAKDDRAFHTLSVNRRWSRLAMPATGKIPPRK